MSKETGGQAFPVSEGAAHRIAIREAGDDEAKYIAESAKALSGMSLRDYFAAKAMQGILSNPSMIDYFDKSSFDWVAERANQLADAMLEARNN